MDQAVQRAQELQLALDKLEAKYNQLVTANQKNHQEHQNARAKLEGEAATLRRDVTSLQEQRQKAQKSYTEEKKKLNLEGTNLRAENQKVVQALSDEQDAHQKARAQFNIEMEALRKTIDALQGNMKQIESLRAQDQETIQQKNAALEGVELQHAELMKARDAQLSEVQMNLDQALNDYLSLSKRFQMMLFDAAQGAYTRGYQEGQAILLYPPVVENNNNDQSN